MVEGIATTILKIRPVACQTGINRATSIGSWGVKILFAVCLHGERQGDNHGWSSVGRSPESSENYCESDNLPTMPGVAQQLLSISDWDNADLSRVADIIRKDVSLSSKALRVVNSPLYGFGQRITNISHAVVLFGLRPTRALALCFCLPNLRAPNDNSGFNYQGFWTRSLNTAVAARELAILTKLGEEEEALLTGLLQDIGVMVMAQCIPRTYVALLKEGEAFEVAPSIEIEKERLGINHVEVAKALFDKWELPPSLRVPVLYHHTPEKAEGVDSHTALSIRVQYIAGLIGEWLYTADNKHSSLFCLKDTANYELGIPSNELEALMRRVDRNMVEISALFELHSARPATYTELIEKLSPAPRSAEKRKLTRKTG